MSPTPRPTSAFVVALVSAVLCPILIMVEFTALFFAAMVNAEAANSTFVKALTVAIVIVIGLVAMRRTRTHPALVAYTIGVVALMLSPATVTARPRFVITAFGLLLASAAWWEDHGPSDPSRRRNVELVVIATSAAGLVTVTAIYGLLGAIP